MSPTLPKHGNDVLGEQRGASTMSILPWPTLVRSYLITFITSSRLLLKPSLGVLGMLARSKYKLLNPEANRVLYTVLRKTFYDHFCAGESPQEVRQAVKRLKKMGYAGVLIGHAREEVLSKEEKARVEFLPETAAQEKLNHTDIQRWRKNTLATLDLSEPGDFVALKFTGAGKQALKHLKLKTAPAPALDDAIHDICRKAQERGVGLLFDAEQAFIQQGIDDWTLHYMKAYNKGKQAVVFATYQAYAKRTPEIVAQHLKAALENDIIFGIKLVRGAYLGSDPRNLFWDTIEQTHDAYDNIARCMIEQRYDGILKPANGASSQFPRVSFVLASHNASSVRKAQELRAEQAHHGVARIPLAYGQLLGMADHVSCELLQEAERLKTDLKLGVDVPQAYKYVVWGTMGECMKYLFRRAEENRDAVTRTKDARKALGKEVARRLGLAS